MQHLSLMSWWQSALNKVGKQLGSQILKRSLLDNAPNYVIGCIIQKRYLQSGQGKSEQVAVCSVSPTHLAPVKTGSVQVRVRLVVPKNLENILWK